MRIWEIEEEVPFCKEKMRLLQNDASSKGQAVIAKITEKMDGLNNSRKAFMEYIITLYLSMRGRYTFEGMSRYGVPCEKTHRLHFEQEFVFLSFNTSLCQETLSEHRIIAFDRAANCPSYLPKSGKHTPHHDTFWSDCLGKAVKGLEIGGLAVVDVDNNTAISLEAVQTPNRMTLQQRSQSLLDHYAQLFIERNATLNALSDYVVADGYFAKKPFVGALCHQTNLQIISKLRKDARLKYLYQGKPTGKRGRPKCYDGNVTLAQLEGHHFSTCYQDEAVCIHEAVVFSVSLKRKIMLAYVRFKDENGKLTDRYALYFCTNLRLEGYWIYRYYKARFQRGRPAIEFLFRDAKQHTGLTHCQARSENKLYLHFNTALSAVSIAKAAHYIDVPPADRSAFSLADIKTQYFNEQMLNLFLGNFQLDADLKENKTAIQHILNYGRLAA